MTNLKTTKRALLSSVLALMLCFAMLLGTTFAWFTDTAVSAGNKIVAGTLDVELYQWTSETQTEGTNISTSQTPVFTADTIWEPGMTQVRYLSIKNNGNLALKYKVALEVTDISDDSLLEVMEYDIPYTSNVLMDKLGLKSKEGFRRNYLRPAVDMNLIQMTIPDKPNSKNQRYVKG